MLAHSNSKTHCRGRKWQL